MDLNLDSSAIIAAISAVAAVVSAGAAWNQANQAKEASKAVLQAETRASRLAVVQMAKDCEHTVSQIRQLEGDLGSALRMSQVKRGIRQDSSTDMLLKVARDLTSQAEDLCVGLPAYLPPKAEALLADTDAVHTAQMKLTPVQRDLHRIRDLMQGHLTKVQTSLDKV